MQRWTFEELEKRYADGDASVRAQLNRERHRRGLLTYRIFRVKRHCAWVKFNYPAVMLWRVGIKFIPLELTFFAFA